jgi:hypothetical protein
MCQQNSKIPTRARKTLSKQYAVELNQRCAFLPTKSIDLILHRKRASKYEGTHSHVFLCSASNINCIPVWMQTVQFNFQTHFKVRQKDSQTGLSRQLNSLITEDMLLYCKDTLPHKLSFHYTRIFWFREYASDLYSCERINEAKVCLKGGRFFHQRDTAGLPNIGFYSHLCRRW